MVNKIEKLVFDFQSRFIQEKEYSNVFEKIKKAACNYMRLFRRSNT